MRHVPYFALQFVFLLRTYVVILLFVSNLTIMKSSNYFSPNCLVSKCKVKALKDLIIFLLHNNFF